MKLSENEDLGGNSRGLVTRNSIHISFLNIKILISAALKMTAEMLQTSNLQKLSCGPLGLFLMKL